MDARTDPRRRLSVPVELHCDARNCHVQGRVKDISTGGMFVTAPACAQPGWQFDICMNLPDQENELRINAAVRRTTSYGFGLQFPVGAIPHRTLEDILLPNWDGNNVCEGLIIFCQREEVTDFSAWLRLTSLVCNQYRRCARARVLSQKRKW